MVNCILVLFCMKLGHQVYKSDKAQFLTKILVVTNGGIPSILVAFLMCFAHISRSGHFKFSEISCIISLTLSKTRLKRHVWEKCWFWLYFRDHILLFLYVFSAFLCLSHYVSNDAVI